MKNLALTSFCFLFTYHISFCQECWKMASPGAFHTVAIKLDGTLWAWGNNGWGQLGDGTFDSSPNPIQIGWEKDWLYVSAGHHHNVAIKKDSTLWIWGENFEGELGNGTYTGRNYPIKISNDKWISATAGGYHTLAIKSDGSLWAWGDNSYGQIGDGSYIGRNTPVQIEKSSEFDWVSVDAGYNYSLAVRIGVFPNDYSLWRWGYNDDGELGSSEVEITLPKRLINHKIRSIYGESYSAGLYHTLLRSDKGLYATGINDFGELGTGIEDAGTSNFTKISNSGEWWSQIATGDFHSIGIMHTSQDFANYIWAWGDNQYGQLGVGSNINHSTRTKLEVDFSVASIAANANHNIAIGHSISDGNFQLYTWGANAYGQLGDGTYESRNVPVHIDCPLSTSTNYDEVQEPKYSIWPNPTKSYINVELDQNIFRHEITITNSLGQMVKKILNASNEERIELSGLESGIYIIRLPAKNGYIVRSFVKI